MKDEQDDFESAVARAVERARESGCVLRTGEAAHKLRSENPDCNLALRQIAEIVARKAISAGVSVQFTSPETLPAAPSSISTGPKTL